MWFKVENKRSSLGQKFVVSCNSEIAGPRVVEERPAQGPAAARKTAEILGSTLNVTATVYGTDANGEFVYGVYEVADGAAAASSPLIKRLFAESAAASLTLKDSCSPISPRTPLRVLPQCLPRWDTLLPNTSKSSARPRRRLAIRPCFVSSAGRVMRARFRCRPTTPPSQSLLKNFQRCLTGCASANCPASPLQTATPLFLPCAQTR